MTNALIETPIITEEDLLRLNAQDQRVELFEGEIVPMSAAGFEHVVIAGNIYDILKPFARKHRLGYVLSDSLIYVLRVYEGGLRDTRIPDVSFIRKGRLPKPEDIHRPFHGVPDLAVEVVSPSETAESLMKKVRDYLGEGTEEVWVVYPDLKEIHIFEGREADIVRIYREGDTFTAETLFPGLQIAVAEFFLQDDFEESES
jgi:Uma2 family endonuclease